MEKIRFVGGKFLKVSASRNPDFSGQPSMKNSLNILGIEKAPETKDIIKVKYSFVVDYFDLGNVQIEGEVFLTSGVDFLDKIVKGWSEKNLEKDILVIITNIVMRKASIRAFQLEDELGLPLHMRLPTLNIDDSSQNNSESEN